MTWRSVNPITRVASVACRVTQADVTKSTEHVLSDNTIVGNQAIVAMNLSTSVSSMNVYTSPGPKTP